MFKNITRIIISAIIIVFLSSCNAKLGKQLVLQPGWETGKDALVENWVFQNYINRNFGQHPEFQASAWTSKGRNTTVRGLIDFNTKEIPKRKKIKKATLYLYAVGNTVNGPGHSKLSGSNKFIIRRITSKWDEMTVSWNNQPSTSSENQVIVQESKANMQDYIIDITNLVQDIIKNPKDSYGIMISLENENYYRRILFASSDYNDASKHPKLVIE